MPVESATYIADLVPTDPEVTDGIAQGYSHIQLIKSVLQNTFPDLGDAAVTATAVEINSVVGLVDNASGSLTAPIPTGSTTVGGSVILAGAGTNAEVVLTNVEGGLAVTSGSQLCVLMDPVGNTAFNGIVNASEIEQLSAALLPTGMIMQWYGSIATIPAGWLLCDGTNGTPNLTGGLFVASADGVVLTPGQTGGAASVTGTTNTAGSHSHTGATASGGGQALTGSADNQGTHSHGGADGAYTLQIADIPSHTHQQITQGSGGIVSSINPPGGGSGGLGDVQATQATGGGGSHSHTISADGLHTHNISVSAVNAHTHGISVDGSHNHSATVPTIPPYYALVYIMKS